MHQQKRNKTIGWADEVAALRGLIRIFPRLRRVGSIGYSKAHPDLVQDGLEPAINMIVTRDANQPQLVSLALSDLVLLIDWAGDSGVEKLAVRIQVKHRQKTWIGGP